MKCSLGFSYNPNFLSNLMRKFMHTPYSHVFLLFEVEGRELVLHCTRVGVNSMSFEAFKKHNEVVGLIELQDQAKIGTAFNYCIDKLGVPYGFLNVLALALHIHYEDGEKTLICSEFVSRALGFEPGVLPETILPSDLAAYK